MRVDTREDINPIRDEARLHLPLLLSGVFKVNEEQQVLLPLVPD